jgi:hypothetical protein
MKARHIITLAFVTTALAIAAPARAQDDEFDGDGPADPYGAAPEVPINEAIASSLVDRGQVLFDQGDFEGAKQLFAEALERSPEGPSSAKALEMLRSSNARLGLDRDDGRPGVGGASTEPLDPYATVEEPLDPYADPKDGMADPTRQPQPDTPPEVDIPDTDEPNTQPSRGLMAWGAGYGFMLGMAIGGPLDENDDLRGGALLVGLVGAGAGIGGAYLGSRRWAMSRGQVAAIASAGNWVGLNAAFVGDLVTDTGTDTNDIYKSIAVGGALGLGTGILYARAYEPDEGDIAFTNSLGTYGLASGLMLGVAMSPPRSEAYSINSMVGSIGGVAAGLLLSPRVDMSRRRTLRIDLGAGLGLASTWALFYPLIEDGDTNNDEQLAGGLSVLTMWGGAALMYYLTRDLDEPAGAGEELEVAERHPAPPGLVRRGADGGWSLGAPMLRPMADPELAPPTGLSMGVDLASGRF